MKLTPKIMMEIMMSKIALPAQFDFFLDAYWFCQKNKISTERIEKVSFKVWKVV